ncbi:MAG: DUF2027 domain-containing protein [Bacteroidales bacterium]|nr:DUF2027 domain-containing protein [Bacteroidales bacterium]
MALNIGDKVSFLNEKGSGIVKKNISHELVSVEIEDGFEIPVMVKELIKLSSPDLPKENFRNETIDNITETLNTKTDSAEISTDIISPLYDSLEFSKKSIFLCIEPVNQKKYLSDGFRVKLLNYTDYEILFSCYKKSGFKLNAFNYDACAPQSQYLLAEIDNSQLNDWTNLLFHFLFYAEDLPVKEPLVKEIKVNHVHFFKDSSFKLCSLTRTICHLITIDEETLIQDFQDEESDLLNISHVPVKDIKKIMDGTEKVSNMDKKHIVAPYIAEVDLHIEQLTDHFSGLSKHEMLTLQINYFLQCLDAAIVHKFKKITFIHGVGQGVLKQEILRIIDENYKNLRIQDGPFKKFGQGATEVLIPFNLTR